MDIYRYKLLDTAPGAHYDGLQMLHRLTATPAAALRIMSMRMTSTGGGAVSGP
jgi:hypothetical protein